MTDHTTPSLTLVTTPPDAAPPRAADETNTTPTPAPGRVTTSTAKTGETITDPVTDWDSLVACRRVAIKVEEVAGHLGLDRRTVEAAIDSGQIPSTKIGQQRLMNRLRFAAPLRQGTPRSEGGRPPAG